MSIPKNRDVEELADELFTAIQIAQGYAHCSDGETFASIPDFFTRIRGRLKWSEETTKIMRGFLRKYHQLERHHPVKSRAAHHR